MDITTSKLAKELQLSETNIHLIRSLFFQKAPDSPVSTSEILACLLIDLYVGLGVSLEVGLSMITPWIQEISKFADAFDSTESDASRSFFLLELLDNRYSAVRWHGGHSGQLWDIKEHKKVETRSIDTPIVSVVVNVTPVLRQILANSDSGETNGQK
jgi:hypothetical protein